MREKRLIWAHRDFSLSGWRRQGEGAPPYEVAASQWSRKQQESLLSVAVMNIVTKSYLGRKGLCQLPGYSPWRDARGGTEAATMEECHPPTCSSWLACSACIYSIQDHLPGVACGLGPSTSSIPHQSMIPHLSLIKKMSHKHGHRSIWWRPFHSEVPSAQRTLEHTHVYIHMWVKIISHNITYIYTHIWVKLYICILCYEI